MWFNKTLGSTKRWKLAFTWRTTPVQTDSAVSVRRRNTLPEFVDGSWAQTLISSGGYYGFWAVREPVRVRVRVCACARVWAGPVWRSSFLFLFSFLNLRSCLICSFLGRLLKEKVDQEKRRREREREKSSSRRLFFSLFIRLESPPPPRPSVSSASLVPHPTFPGLSPSSSSRRRNVSTVPLCVLFIFNFHMT